MKLGNAMDGKVDGWETLMVEVFKTNVWNNKLRTVLVMKQEASFQQVKSVARLFGSQVSFISYKLVYKLGLPVCSSMRLNLMAANGTVVENVGSVDRNEKNREIDGANK